MSIIYHLEIKGSLEYSESDKMYHGKLLDIKGLWMYEGNTENECLEQFIEVVEQYLEYNII